MNITFWGAARQVTGSMHLRGTGLGFSKICAKRTNTRRLEGTVLCLACRSMMRTPAALGTCTTGVSDVRVWGAEDKK